MMKKAPEITPDEILVFCIANQLKDGEIVAQGIATPLIAAAYLLASATHAPNLYFTSAIGQSLCRRPAPLGLTRVEELWLDRSLTNVGFVRAAADILPGLRPKEFFRPAQIDPSGNFNNIAFGSNYERPRLRLPGTGGIPDVTTFIDDIFLYVPRHSRITFVPELDYISGLGHHYLRRWGSGPRYLVTDLGQFDFKGENKNGKPSLRLISYHRGTDIDFIQNHTGFELQIATDLHETPLPSPDDLHLLRTKIDPFGIRKLESLSGAPRRQLLRQIIISEKKSSLRD